MEKLIYTEYKGCRDIITIDLHNGYTIIAIKIWNRDKENYTVEFRIKDNTVEKWDLIEKAESIEINANYKTINSAILKQVALYFEEGFFDYYIRRYQHDLKCFDVGYDCLEKEGGAW